MAGLQYNHIGGDPNIASATVFAKVVYLSDSPPTEQGNSEGMRDEEEESTGNVPSSPAFGMHYKYSPVSRTTPLESGVPLSETIGFYNHSSALSGGYETKPSTIYPVTSWYINDSGLWNSTTIPGSSLSSSSPARDIIVGTLLSLVCFAVVFGNALVVLAIYREKYLRTTTNFFIASLACADFLIGSIVLPFAIYQELRPSQWIFGYAWCDGWHAMDVLLCTSSIMNLTVIAVDRFWAITMPLNYPTRMTKKLGAFLIAVVWIVSSLISFPCIAWWHAVEPTYPEDECIFPSNAIYLVLSSCISFYIPSLTMIFLYWKVFITATEQVRSIRTGTKKFGGHEGQMMRIHRGGNSRIERNPLQRKMNGSTVNGSPCGKYGSMGVMMGGHEKKKFFSGMAKEHKAAKTLGIVMGVFILCWLPFFIVNITAPLCPDCIVVPHVTFPVVVWLGYANSACNPVIYAFTSRSYKRAFRRILCVCFPGMKKRKDPWRRGRLISMSNMSSADSSMTLVDYGESIRITVLDGSKPPTTVTAHKYNLTNTYF